MDIKQLCHARWPNLIADSIAWDARPRRCKADLHELAPGHRGGCMLCAREKTSQARVEQGAR